MVFILKKKWEKKAKPSNEKKRRKQSFLIYMNKKNKSGIVYIVYVGVARAWYLGVAIDGELLDHEFSGSY